MKFICSVLLFLLISVVHADNNAVLQSANTVYAKGNYAKAQELYLSILKNNFESADLYYNLGNTYFKQSDFPSAILYYEKALKLKPGDEDIQYNLRFANSKKIDKIEELPVLFYKQWFNTISNFFSIDGWAKLAVLLSLLFMLALILFLVSRKIILKKIGFWFGVTFLILSVISVCFAEHSYSSHFQSKAAIVFAPTLTVKSTPDENSVNLFVIHEGTKVFILDQTSNWYRIKIEDGSNGWVNAEALKEI